MIETAFFFGEYNKSTYHFKTASLVCVLMIEGANGLKIASKDSA